MAKAIILRHLTDRALISAAPRPPVARRRRRPTAEGYHGAISELARWGGAEKLFHFTPNRFRDAGGRSPSERSEMRSSRNFM